MALNIRDEEVDRLATELAQARRTTKTQAVKLALQHELARTAPPLKDRLRDLQDSIESYAETGQTADKSFFDELSGEP